MNNNKAYKDYDEEFKFVIVGSSGVGKSALIVRFVDDKFKDDLLATIGVDFRFRTMTLEGKKIKMQIWDTAGQENFRTIISAYYRGADAIIMVYDIAEYTTFLEINKFWVKQIEDNKQPQCEIMLLGNKSDKQSLHKPTAEEITQVKQQLKTDLYFETSAKTSDEVQKAFNELVSKLLKKRAAKNGNKPAKMTLETERNDQKKRKCC